MGKEKSNDSSHESNHAEMEKFAAKLVADWSDGLAKLKQLAPAIEKVEEYFRTHVRGSVTLMGCSSFKGFCEKRLKRDRSTVYKMLKSFKQKSEKDTDEPDNKKSLQTAKRIELKQELAEARAKVERLLPLGQAAGKVLEAIKSSDEEKMEEALKELRFTVESTPHTGLNAHDRPNTELMLNDLLAEIQRVGDRIYPVAPTLVRLANAQIKRLSLQGKIGYVQSEPTFAASTAVAASPTMESEENCITGLRVAPQRTTEMPQGQAAAS